LLHLALIAEYVLIPAEGGKARFATEKDIQQLPSEMGLPL